MLPLSMVVLTSLTYTKVPGVLLIPILLLQGLPSCGKASDNLLHSAHKNVDIKSRLDLTRVTIESLHILTVFTSRAYNISKNYSNSPQVWS